MTGEQVNIYVSNGFAIKYDMKRSQQFGGDYCWLVTSPDWLRMGWFRNLEKATAWTLKQGVNGSLEAVAEGGLDRGL